MDRLGWAAASRRPKPQPKISTSASSLARLKSRRRVKLGCRPPNCINSIRQNLFQARQSTIECRARSSGALFSLHVAGRAPRLVQLLSRAPAMNSRAQLALLAPASVLQGPIKRSRCHRLRFRGAPRRSASNRQTEMSRATPSREEPQARERDAWGARQHR